MGRLLPFDGPQNQLYTIPYATDLGGGGRVDREHRVCYGDGGGFDGTAKPVGVQGVAPGSEAAIDLLSVEGLSIGTVLRPRAADEWETLGYSGYQVLTLLGVMGMSRTGPR